MKIQAQALLLGTVSAIVWGVNVAPSYAINLIGNLPPTNDVGGSLLSVGGSDVRAVSFTLPTGTDYILQNAVLRLSGYATGTDVFKVQIRNDTGGTNPGSTVLANFNLPSSQGTGFDYTFTSGTALTFQQNTKYWLYVDISAGSGGSGNFNWHSSVPLVTPAGAASFGAYRTSNDGGTSFFDGSGLYNSFQINADAVAVPWETDALSVIGSTVLFGLGLWARNKLAQRKIDNLK
jgi:hypothetical protein